MLREILVNAGVSIALLGGLLANAEAPASPSTTIHKANSIAMHGEPKYPKDFQHFDYTTTGAPKGGTLVLGVQGTFDSLNSFIAKGVSADGLELIYDSLTEASADEPFTRYGLIAEQMIWPEDRSWIEFVLRDEAKFHDGSPITADDVEFTFDTLIAKGSPTFKTMFEDVASVEAKGPHRIRFTMKNTENQELILILGSMSILSKQYWHDRDFSKTTLEAPLGSGPYTVAEVESGKTIHYRRNPDYWGKDLPVNRGRYNFDLIEYDYYRDATVLLEALKAGEYDFRYERISKQWATGYDSDALRSGKLVMKNIKHEIPQGIQAFILNTRNPLFKDIRVRKALNYAFDFEWTNANLFYNAYTRADSYYSNSEFAAHGMPSEAELALLNPLKDQLPGSVFVEPFELPTSKGDGRNRQALRKAKQLFSEAGWTIKNNVLTNSKGKTFTFEFLMFDPSMERVINPFIRALKRLGVQASIRKVEISQYINRLRNHNFDVVVSRIPQSLSPGLEQIQYFHSSTSDQKSGNNLAGIANPAIDALIENVVQAKSREELVVSTKALDRALLHNWYVIPQWYIDSHRVAYWNKFGQPDITPKYDATFSETLNTWWYDPKKSAQPAKQ
ncbi:Oligopeptide-binding protein AppA [BD1-7 clade bacterium]|uniref:Oligopeptide-binding protein AppA n=1 Tax=BD1-7 clade bacterium TaxID=2029982 RepID=A0A5S9QKP5_9GAMM|nr:Oligopeptide-binding protein AppA [BD1-7 clade bacterium]